MICDLSIYMIFRFLRKGFCITANMVVPVVATITEKNQVTD